MILTTILSMMLRIGQFICAAVVAGINGYWLHRLHPLHVGNNKGRFIYTEVIAAISIVLALLWLLPFSAGFIHWPIDLLLAIAWFVAFGLAVNYLDGKCNHRFFTIVYDNGLSSRCSTWKADEAFMFISGFLWLVSALLGLYWLRKHRTVKAENGAPNTNRRAWYRNDHQAV